MGGSSTPTPGLGGCQREEKRKKKVRQRCPSSFVITLSVCGRERARECLCASVCICVCVPVCARVCKCMSACAGRDRPGVAGPEGARLLCPKGS